MPAITRSQNKLNINQVNLIIRLDSDNNRVVFNTPNDSIIDNTEFPPTPKAPRAKKQTYDSFGSVVRRLDFTESNSERPRYPLNYRNFIIANKFQKVKVDNFLEMIDIYVNDRTFAKKGDPKSSVHIDKNQIAGLSNSDLLNMANSLNANTKFWEIFTKYTNEKKTLNKIILQWSQLLCSLIITYLLRVMSHVNTILCEIPNERQQYIIENIIPVLIKYKDILVSDKFEAFSRSRRFLGVMIRKMLEFTDQGLVHSAMVIMHYYPDMATKECYPCINSTYDSIIYFTSFADINRTDNKDISELFTKYKIISNLE